MPRPGIGAQGGKMILETPRLILRPFAADDLDRMAELMANKDFMRFSMGPMTQEQTKSFLDKVIGWDRERMPSQFAMIVRSSETFAGYCGFFHHEVDGKMEIEIGYRLDSGCCNRGLASEAARTVRDHGFRDLKLDYVISLIHPENHPSRRVAEKNGMILERETTFRRFPDIFFRDYSGAVAATGVWRRMNSSAKVR
jgi:ribosomal-protein-alanine N-acetyltransferase